MPDIIVCTETHKIVLPNFYEMESYCFYHINSKINKCNGTCIYVLDEIQHKNEIIPIGKIKALFTGLSLGSDKLYITSLYRSQCIAISTFIDDIREHLLEKKL